MTEKEKATRATKSEKAEKRVNKPIQAIKKLKDHFYKLSKKSKSGTTDTVLPIIRNADVTSKTTDASRTPDTCRSGISHSIESIGNVEPSREPIISRNVEPVELRVTSISNSSEPIRNADLSRSIVTSRNINLSPNVEINRNGTADFQIPNITRSPVDISRNSDIPHMADTFHVNGLSRDMEMSRNIDLPHNVKEISKNGENTDITHGKSLANDQKSLPDKADQLQQPRTSQSLLVNAKEIKDIKTELPEKTEVEKLSDTAIEQQLASLNQRLKSLIDENEKTNKREEQLFTTKNQIVDKIDLVKKQIGEAMDHYRDIAHACHEKIEKEEILQNEMLMDLKERVDKLNDICTDINNQADDMIATLNAHSIGKSDALYLITACSVDFIVRFFQQIYATIISITKHFTKALLATSNSASPTAISKEKKIDTLLSTSL